MAHSTCNPRGNAPAARFRALRQHGFTLVELMVAVALGLVLMVALIAVYLNVSRTNSEMYKTNGMIENGRFAIDVLNEDLSHAGYWGGYVPRFDDFSLRAAPGDMPTQAALDMGPCAAYASWTADYRTMLIGVPVEVYDNAAPPGCNTSTLIKDRKADTDVLVVRHSDTCSPGDPNCDALDATKVYFQSSQCAAEIEAGTLYALSNNPLDFVLHGRSCAAPVQPLRRLVSNIYYVRTWASTEGDGIPTLVRASFGLAGGLPSHEAAQALIEGVEGFRVELGRDVQTRCSGAVNYGATITLGPIASGGNLVNPSNCLYDAGTPGNNVLPLVRGDGVPESYIRCGASGCPVADLMNVVAVKVFVLARSKESSPQYDDDKSYALGSAAAMTFTGADRRFKRHLFQTTVRMTNISGRRETPTL